LSREVDECKPLDDGNGYFMYNLDQGAAGTNAPYPTQVCTDTPHTPLIRS
jgi:hypothetical protein